MIKQFLHTIALDGTYKDFWKFVFAGAGMGIGGEMIENIDWIVGFALKSFSVISIAIGIFISIPKVVETVKYLKGKKPKK